ncbi:hypothetical protein N783_10515 [Pontibacillus marinus BH030004 = DSM 16465]|uniref:Uncharacterized protein n=1 Tax=Pontibacillus marinus BH030004 = DSM 16465 TaxID=1385511 RepID=A0A0A5G7S1_9BACI|nr:hypothetical protein N783_10515 [Pontibacillus marinus BH030004 = DSM 16465]
MGTVKNTAMIGATLLFIRNPSTNTIESNEEVDIFTTCVNGNFKNLDKVGFTLYVK